jgi:hypothetical protein
MTTCPECSKRTAKDDLDELEDYSERVAPGEFCPAGQCPNCGALIQVDDDDIPDYTLRDGAQLAIKKGLSDDYNRLNARHTALVDAVRAMLREIEAMRIDPKQMSLDSCDDDDTAALESGAWIGPFSQYVRCRHSGSPAVEWPNLLILANQVQELCGIPAAHPCSCCGEPTTTGADCCTDDFPETSLIEETGR